VACGLARHQRAYLLDGLRHSAECQFIDTFDELDRLLPTLTRCDALVLAPQDHRGRDALDTVERVARDWPAAGVVMLFPPRAEAASSIRSLVLAGAHALVFDGVHDTATSLAQAVENARREVAAQVVFRRLQPLIPSALHSMAHAVVSRPEALTSVALVAVALGVHRKTLVNRCARCRSLQPAAFILWCRLAMVGYLLERTGCTVESIAMTLGFPSHTALRNMIKRYTGRIATDIRREGGLGAVLTAFGARMSAKYGGELAHTVTFAAVMLAHV